MCGIAGLIGIRDEGGALATRMLAAIRHRGPDDEGVARPHPMATLINTRLAVIDLSAAGHQPMADHPRDGREPITLAFNGEIYNHRDLRRELGEAGIELHTLTDTEVILAAYRRWGADCVSHLAGMFAICIVDPDTRMALLVRDRMGIKPLYLYRPVSGGLACASEVRALLALGPEIVPPVVDRGALESYLAQGAPFGYRAIVRGIEMLPPATSIWVGLDDGRERERRVYWQLPCELERPGSRASQVERLGAIARDCVRDHLISDAPLGLFLSGGVDSSSLLTLAAEESNVRTLTVGFDSREFDESAESAAAARTFNLEHSEVPLTAAEVQRDLDQALSAMDQPTVDGFNTFFVSRAARDSGLTVALSGLGGDELFGGYASFLDVPRAVAMRRSAARSAFAMLGGAIIRTRFGAKLLETVNRPAELLSMYLLRRELFLPDERRSIHPLPAGVDAMNGLECALLDSLRSQSQDFCELNQISLFELRLYMEHMLLRDSDSFSMAAPLEYRVPFLDHRLVDAVFALPGEWKAPDPRPKPLLLDLVGPRLPEAVWQRAKRGFTFPWAVWLTEYQPLAELARAAANDTGMWASLGLEPAGVVQTWRRFTSGDKRVSPLQVLATIVLRDYASRHHLSA